MKEQHVPYVRRREIAAGFMWGNLKKVTTWKTEA
jgi:hypothetical protein